MSHITLSCILSVKIDFSLDSDSKYYEVQEKKGLHFFIFRENGPKWRNPRWPPTYIKINIFAKDFATTYARDINNMFLLMFSGMRTQILSFVFRKKCCKVYIYANISEKDGYRSEAATNIVLADRFFSVLLMLGWFPYGDIWADVELSSLWVFL